MPDCIFCKIANKDIPSTVLYEDEDLLAFRDVDPKAPTHFLVIPKKHIPSAHELGKQDASIAAKIFTVIPKIADELGIENGYRIVTNIGPDGGQAVPHLHFHVLAGRPLSWPPG